MAIKKQYFAKIEADGETDIMTLYDAHGARVWDEGEVIAVEDRTVWSAFTAWLRDHGEDGDIEAFARTAEFEAATARAFNKLRERMIRRAARVGISAADIDFTEAE